VNCASSSLSDEVIEKSESQQASNPTSKTSLGNGSVRGEWKKKKNKKHAGEEDEVSENPIEQPPYNPDSPHLYDLFAVVIHAGSAHAGHYYAYIKDGLAEEWWKEEQQQQQGKEGEGEGGGEGKGSKNKSFWFNFDNQYAYKYTFWTSIILFRLLQHSQDKIHFTQHRTK